jgi:threonine/homoserine efflux transporter RhtA
LGAAAFAVCVGYAIAAAWRGTRASDSRRALAICLLAVFVIILTHGLFDTIYWATKPAIFLWGTLGLALALARVSSDLLPNSS